MLNRFLVVVRIDQVNYPPVEGTSKKDAKTKACEEVLKIMQQSADSPESNSLPSVNQVCVFDAWLQLQIIMIYANTQLELAKAFDTSARIRNGWLYESYSPLGISGILRREFFCRIFQ